MDTDEVEDGMDSKKKKYVLFKGEPGAVKPCAFFLLPEGCKNGFNCKFAHGNDDNKPKISNEPEKYPTVNFSKTSDHLKMRETKKSNRELDNTQILDKEKTNSIPDSGSIKVYEDFQEQTTRSQSTESELIRQQSDLLRLQRDELLKLQESFKKQQDESKSTQKRTHTPELKKNKKKIEPEKREKNDLISPNSNSKHLTSASTSALAPSSFSASSILSSLGLPLASVNASEFFHGKCSANNLKVPSDFTSTIGTKRSSIYPVANYGNKAIKVSNEIIGNSIRKNADDEDEMAFLFGVVDEALRGGSDNKDFQGAQIYLDKSNKKLVENGSIFVDPDNVLKALNTSGTSHATGGSQKNSVSNNRTITRSISENNKYEFFVEKPPTHTSLSDWEVLVQKTKTHVKFSNDYNFNSDATWIEAKPYGDW